MTDSSAVAAPGPRAARSPESITAFVVGLVAELLGCDTSTVDPGAPMESLALDSLEAVIITGDLSTWLGWEVDETLPWQVATLAELASLVAAEDTRRTRGGMEP